MEKILGIAGILLAAALMAAIDAPKFDSIEKEIRGRHKAVFWGILLLFVLVSAAEVLLRA